MGAGDLTLRSPECVVRSFRPDDASSLARHGNNRKIWLNLRDRFPHPYTEENARAYIAMLAANPASMSWAIEVDGEAVGGIAVHPRDDIERIGGEIGYWLGESLWGRGVVTSAIRLVSEHLLGGGTLERLFAIPFVHNTASCRALEKAGYVREGVRRIDTCPGKSTFYVPSTIA